MKTEVLKEFIVLAQYLNYSVAAEKLYMPQPRLSVHITELETEIGFPLFARGKQLSLTPEGKRFLRAADRALNELDAAIASGIKSSKQEKYRITVMAPPMTSQFPPEVPTALSRTFTEASRLFPALSAAMPVTSRTSTELDALRKGKTDIGYLLASKRLLENPPAGIIIKPLVSVRLTAWVTKNHALAKRTCVTLEELADYTVNVPGALDISTYRDCIVSAFKDADLDPVYQTTFVESAEASLTQLPKEDEITMGPDYLTSFTQFGLVPLQIVDAPEPFLSIAYLAESDNAFVHTFANLLLKQHASMSEERERANPSA